MNSTKETKVMRAEKEVAQSRRSFLRLGALGAAAVLAAGVLPTGEAKAQTNARKAATVRSAGTTGVATGNRETRKLRSMRSKGEIAAKAEDGAGTRSTRSMSKQATQRSAKATKSATGNRSASTRKMGTRSAQRSMKALKQTKS
jgi:hypothetical protein